MSERPVDATDGAIVRRLLDLCDELERGPGIPAHVTDGVRQALAEPLRLAVVGRVKAGKSTIVNALVGRRVAPVRAGECTRVVTWYRHGSPDRAELVLRDGTTEPLRFVDGRLPEDLPVPVADVERIDVHLQSRALEHLVLLDTPGLATTTTDLESATRRALLGAEDSSQRAAAQADALLFLFRDTEKADEVDFLDEFRSATGQLGGSAVNVVGLLSHADLYGDGVSQDPVQLAGERAAELAAGRSEQVATVLPVSGLLAETARTGRFRQDHVRLLAQIAEADADELTLWSMGLGDAPDGLDELVELIGPYGLSAAREVAAEGRVTQVLAWLEDASGLAALEQLVTTRLVRRSAPIKADHALTVLEAAAGALPDPRRADQALDAVDHTRLDPQLHAVREVRALSGLLRTAPSHPLVPQLTTLVDAADDATRVGLGEDASPSEIARRARELADTAQATSALAATSDAADAARVASRSYALVARRAEVRS